ncbi:WD40 repeat domain-containing protein, partial [Roseiflexus sp.]|uniref:WD40 repeat domain-containing protein n=1 Tax=Roseiflexus sp. TaxID=2562120 RepID=UPI00398ABCE4
TAAVQNVTFSPDGQMLLSGGADGTTRLWNVGDGREIRRFAGHQGSLGAYGSVAFLYDGACGNRWRRWRHSLPAHRPSGGDGCLETPVVAGTDDQRTEPVRSRMPY